MCEDPHNAGRIKKHMQIKIEKENIKLGLVLLFSFFYDKIPQEISSHLAFHSLRNFVIHIWKKLIMHYIHMGFKE